MSSACTCTCSRPKSSRRGRPAPSRADAQGRGSAAGIGTAAATFHIPLAVLLYALLVVVLLAGVVLSIWWARRLRPPGGPGKTTSSRRTPEGLREAVESGRSALRTLDDARAAIIACYVAMESSLAERGAARGVADTPDELLARATETGVVRGTAAARLTALFYEARFSSHPLDRRQRDAAEQALDELAAALARPERRERPGQAMTSPRVRRPGPPPRTPGTLGRGRRSAPGAARRRNSSSRPCWSPRRPRRATPWPAGRACPWWPSRRRRPRCWCCAPCCRS